MATVQFSRAAEKGRSPASVHEGTTAGERSLKTQQHARSSATVCHADKAQDSVDMLGRSGVAGPVVMHVMSSRAPSGARAGRRVSVAGPIEGTP